MRKIAALLLLTVTAAFLASCSAFSFQNVNDLLQVPALGQGQDAIQKALVEYLGEKPQYKFPKEGDNRSPLIMGDLNGDGIEEGVLFYSAGGSTPQGEARYANVCMAVLEQHEGVWSVSAEAKGPMSDIASVDTVDFYGTGAIQLVVGYANANMNDKQLVFYSYMESKLSSLYPERYDKYVLGDFTGRGGTDLAVSALSDEASKLYINFFTGESGKFSLMQDRPVQLSENIVSCVGLVPGFGPEGEKILILDCIVTSGHMASLMLKFSDSGEGFYVMDGYQSLLAATIRQSLVLQSRDINGDGIVEIPIEEDIKTRLSDRKFSYVEWKNFTPDNGEGEFPTVEYGILDNSLNLFISLPLAWKGQVEFIDGVKKGEWFLKSNESQEYLLILKEIGKGETPPENALKVPGTRSVFLLLSENIKQNELRKIKMTVL